MALTSTDKFIITAGLGGIAWWWYWKWVRDTEPKYAVSKMPKVDLSGVDFLAGLGAKKTKAERDAAIKARKERLAAKQAATKSRRQTARTKAKKAKKLKMPKGAVRKIAAAMTAKFGGQDVQQFLNNPAPQNFTNPQTPMMIDAFAKQYVVESLAATGKIPTGELYLSPRYALMIGIDPLEGGWTPDGGQSTVAVENAPSIGSIKVASTLPAAQQAPTVSGLVTAAGVKADAFVGPMAPTAPVSTVPSVGPAAIAAGGAMVLQTILDMTPSSKSIASLAATVKSLAQDANNPKLDPGDMPLDWSPSDPTTGGKQSQWWNTYKANNSFVSKTMMALLPYRNLSVSAKLGKRIGDGFMENLALNTEKSISSDMKEGILGNMDSAIQGRASTEKAQLVRRAIMDMADMVDIADIGMKVASLVKTSSKYLDQAKSYAEQKALELGTKAVAINARHQTLLAAQDAKAVAGSFLSEVRSNVEEVGNTMNWVISEMPEAMVKSAIDDYTAKKLGTRIFEDIVDLPEYKKIANEKARQQAAVAYAKREAKQDRRNRQLVASMERKFKWMDQKTASGRMKVALSDGMREGAPKPRPSSAVVTGVIKSGAATQAGGAMVLPSAGTYAGAPGPTGFPGGAGAAGAVFGAAAMPDFAAQSMASAMAMIQSQINQSASQELAIQQAFRTLQQQIGNTVANSGFTLGMPSQNALWAAAENLVKGVIPADMVTQQLNYEMTHPLGPTQGMITPGLVDTSGMIMPQMPQGSSYDPDDYDSLLPTAQYIPPSQSYMPSASTSSMPGGSPFIGPSFPGMQGLKLELPRIVR